MVHAGRRAWLVHGLRLGALLVVGGCGPSEVMAPPDERVDKGTKTGPPPGMKPQESFDPRKRLREKGSASPAPK